MIFVSYHHIIVSDDFIRFLILIHFQICINESMILVKFSPSSENKRLQLMQTSPCCRPNGIKCIGINSLSHEQKRKDTFCLLNYINLILYYIYCLMIHYTYCIVWVTWNYVWTSLVWSDWYVFQMEYTIKSSTTIMVYNGGKCILL